MDRIMDIMENNDVGYKLLEFRIMWRSVLKNAWP